MTMVHLRHLEQLVFLSICVIAAIIASVMLFLIISHIFLNALPALSWYFITTPESATPKIGMGIANAIVGSLIIALVATILATPIAVGTAIYLQRYAKEGRAVKIFRYFIEVLSGTPSIVLGIFGLLLIAIYLGPFTGGFSLISGSIALAILIIPVIERAVEDAIQGTDRLLEEGSYALGATKWETIRYITIPAAMSGILTGVILGFGRAAEESAVVILTAGYSQFMPEFAIRNSDKLAGGVKVYPLQDVIGTLPYSVYHAYENSNVIPMANGFAAAFILICIVLCINLSARIVLTRMTLKGNLGGGTFSRILTAIRLRISSDVSDKSKTVNNIIGSDIPVDKSVVIDGNGLETGRPPEESFAEKIMNPMNRISQHNICAAYRKTEESAYHSSQQKDNNPEYRNGAVRLIIRLLLPFLIPAALLLAISALATFSPIRHILGPASPGLATTFGAGLAGILVFAGIAFGVVFAKKAGAFKAKNRRAGRIGILAGICLVMGAGMVCALAAPSFFSTGDAPVKESAADKKARLDALMAQMEAEEAGEAGSNGASSASVPVQGGAGQVSGTGGQLAAGGMNTSTGVIVPVKDALTLGEVYQYGDPAHRVSATVYDYQVLPYYFWWFIDYNRFVQAVPAMGNSYVVVFVRLENTGTKSIVVPTADQFVLERDGKKYTRLPYMNLSVISSLQATELRNANTREQYYQWIRELGQDKRDYAYLTGEIFYEDTWAMNQTANRTSSGRNATSSNSTVASEYDWYYLKPGPGQAIDGYLIYEVPDEVANKPEQLLMTAAFNQNSGTRWRLKQS